METVSMGEPADLFEIFGHALGLPPDARERYLGSLGAGSEVLERVRAMLDADARATQLDEARGGLKLLASLDSAPGGSAGGMPTLRGSYRLIRRIGEGGSGTVYEAEQSSPRRRVAIKAIRAGFASRRAVERLRAEADILARLQHPGIAQIIEAGVGEEDQPDQAFIVMELVDGLPIHRHAAERGLDRRGRIELVLRVCEAVAHAHQRGVIHRDLKPANIVVTGDGTPKVLDFGVARLLSPRADRGHTTEHGLLVGTLAYMSPEQASGRGGVVDTRTDIYALGAILYELLGGVPAMPIADRSIAEGLRLIEEHVPRPLGALDRSLRGDVSVVVARAMDKDPSRRFQTVDELADDLRRCMDGRPIRSRPQSLAYIATRHARRHWLVSATACLLLATLVAFALNSTADARRYRSLAASEARARAVEASARALAERERARADAINEQLQSELAASDIERARLEARIGNGFAAETILWPAYFRDPDSPAVRGALWELFEGHPCAWTTVVDGAARAAISPDGDWLAVGTGAGSVVMLDPARGEPIGGLDGGDGSTAVVAMAAESSGRLWVAERSGRVRAIEVGEAGRSMVSRRALEVGENPASLAVNRASGVLVVGQASGQVRVFALDGDDGSPLGSWNTGDALLRALAIDESGGVLAAGGNGRTIRLYALPSGEPRGELAGHRRDITALEFVPGSDGRRLRSASIDQTTRVWSIDAGGGIVDGTLQDIPRLVRHRDDGSIVIAEAMRVWVMDAEGATPRSVAFPRSGFAHAAAHGSEVATIESTGEVRWWTTQRSPSVRRWSVHANWLFGLDVSGPHDLMVSCSGDFTIRFADASGERERGRFALPPRVRARVARFAPDGSVVAVGCADGKVRVFDPVSLELKQTLDGAGGEIYALAFTPDSSMLAAGSFGRSIRFFSTRDWAALGDITDLASRPRGMAFSLDGRTLYSSGGDRSVLIIDALGRVVTGAIEMAAEPWSVVLSPDGRTLACGLFDASLVAVDLATMRKRVGTSRHRLVVAGLDFSPDGGLIVSAGDDGIVRLWDISDDVLRPVRVLDGASGALPVVRFSSDGTRIIAGSSAGTMLSWSLDAHERNIERNAAAARSAYGAPLDGRP